MPTPDTEIHPIEALLFGSPDADAPSKLAAAMITTMLDVGDGISDLVFSPGRPAQVEKHGELTPVDIPEIPVLKAEHTAQIARELIAGNEQALRSLKDQGACDLSYAIPNAARFRVNVFRQRGSYAIVMRVIANKIPTLADLNLPARLKEIASLKNGIVLVTGPTGSGKSSTLAAIVDLINETRAEHILTIEDPIEFLHVHKKGTVHQRQLHADTPTFALALRAALRQAPKVILVGEMRDRGNRSPGVLDPAHHRRVENRGAHHRLVPRVGSANHPHAAGRGIPLFHRPAPHPADERWTDCRARDSQGDDANA